MFNNPLDIAPGNKIHIANYEQRYYWAIQKRNNDKELLHLSLLREEQSAIYAYTKKFSLKQLKHFKTALLRCQKHYQNAQKNPLKQFSLFIIKQRLFTLDNTIHNYKEIQYTVKNNR